MNKLNQLFNISRTNVSLVEILPYIFLPVSFILGSAILNFNIILINIIFLYFCTKSKNWSFANEKLFKWLIIFYIFFVINSINSYFLFEEKNLDKVFKSIFLIKFIILIFASELLLKKKENFQLVNLAWLIIALFVSFDVFFEKSFGKNILGFVSHDQFRIVSFFKDELIVGAFLLCFGFSSITFFIDSKNKKIKLILILLFSIITLSIFLSGERANFLKALIIFFLIISFINFKNLINKKLLLISFLSLLTVLFFLNSNIFYRYVEFFDRLNLNQNTSIYAKVGKIKHFSHYDTAIQIFKDYPITGVGHKRFREECKNEKYFNEELIFSIERCSTHPHQSHFELLSEQGLVGYLLFMFIILSFIIKNLKIFNKNRNIHLLFTTFYLILFFIPLLPSGSLFSTINGTLFWLIFSIGYQNYKSYNNQE